MKKRFAAWVLTIVMVFSLVSVNAFAEETKKQEFVITEDEIRIDTDVEIGSSEERVQEYIEAVFGIGGSESGAKRSAKPLSGYNALIYDTLKAQIALVAAGQRTNTVFEITWADLGLEGKVWTAEELGVDSIVVDGSYNQAAVDALKALLNFDFKQVVHNLLADCPYELYWFDKTEGTSATSYKMSIFYDYDVMDYVIELTTSPTISFAVASEYQGGSLYEVDPATGQTIAQARGNASAIVAQYASSADQDKLLGYKNEICSRVSYNSAAAGGGVSYGNPWQLIYVFDNDSSTNVVCEGYSKAFKYLCDLSAFSSRYISCITVTGNMTGATGAGGHMWNVVRMDDGRNYLVDVTNCDDGTVGAPTGLFLAGVAVGAQWTLADGYTIQTNGVNIHYDYDESTRSTYEDKSLTLYSARYVHHDHIGDPVRENEIPSTCSAEGSYELVAYCSDCGIEISRETMQIAKLPHTEATIPAVAPTCTETGLTQGSKCSVCGEILTAQETVPALGHDYVVDEYVESTCIEEGHITYVCTHDPSHTYTETLATVVHTPGGVERENEVSATCAKEGSYDEVVYCTVCHEELNREKKTIAKLPHTPETVSAAAPTCTETGLTEGSKCSVCGEILTAQETVPALGHDYVGVVTKEATCSKEGVRTYTCTRDPSHTYTEAIEKLPHTPSDAVREYEIAATCSKEGSYDEVVYCSVCHEELSREKKTIAKIAHTPGTAAHENEVAATCTKEGSYDEVVYCTVCHEELSREAKTIEKIPHTAVAIPAVAATCTEDGYTTGSKCSVCEEILTAPETIPALGHEYVSVITKNPSCLEEGVRTYTCTHDSSHTYTEAIEKLPHTPGTAVRENETDPACDKEGGYDEVIYCSVCHEEISRETITTGKLPHIEAEIPAEEPTCTKDGHTAGSKCSVCGEILTTPETIPAIGHDYVGVVTKEATYTEEGEMTYTCTRDSSHTYTETIPKLPRIDIAKATVALGTTSYTYSGSEKKPAVTVTVDSEKLAEGTDYTVSYNNNINAGDAKVVVTGKNKYKGTASATFTIKQKKLTSSGVTLSKTSYVYTGAVKKPAATVKSGSKKLTKDTDYTVKYTNNKSVGKATVTVTGKGNYSGTIKKTFKIVPKATTLKSVTAGSKQFTAKWVKQATQTTGYQIQYSLKKGFTSGNKTVPVSSNKTVSKIVKSLKSGKTYYVRIRTYKTVSGTKYYSAWSDPLKVKTK